MIIVNFYFYFAFYIHIIKNLDLITFAKRDPMEDLEGICPSEI